MKTAGTLPPRLEAAPVKVAAGGEDEVGLATDEDLGGFEGVELDGVGDAVTGVLDEPLAVTVAWARMTVFVIVVVEVEVPSLAVTS